MMGDSFGEGLRSDGETPVHPVVLSQFSMDVTTVTNAMFARFVEATGHVTDAERHGDSAVFHALVQAPSEDVAEAALNTPWWRIVRHADWRRPFGSRSSLEALDDHPVVHVSHHDAIAYCRWAGRALPSEAQWEYAARGTLAGARFPWGDALTPDGQHMANIWQGTFPHTNSAADGWHGTAPARHYAPNGLGLYQMVGNVWEWCADWFDLRTYQSGLRANPAGPVSGQIRVLRGGSYLCHDSYCFRYRVAARNATTPGTTAGNIGFRTVSAL
jgi:formylglycine-generating enzyme required for sulfatase activity